MKRKNNVKENSKRDKTTKSTRRKKSEPVLTEEEARLHETADRIVASVAEFIVDLLKIIRSPLDRPQVIVFPIIHAPHGSKKSKPSVWDDDDWGTSSSDSSYDSWDD